MDLGNDKGSTDGGYNPLHLIAAPFREGSFADPRKLKGLLSFIKLRAPSQESKGDQDSRPSPLSQTLSTISGDHLDQRLSLPPTHDMTEIEAQLTKTFAHDYTACE